MKLNNKWKCKNAHSNLKSKSLGLNHTLKNETSISLSNHSKNLKKKDSRSRRKDKLKSKKLEIKKSLFSPRLIKVVKRFSHREYVRVINTLPLMRDYIVNTNWSKLRLKTKRIIKFSTKQWQQEMPRSSLNSMKKLKNARKSNSRRKLCLMSKSSRRFKWVDLLFPSKKTTNTLNKSLKKSFISSHTQC